MFVRFRMFFARIRDAWNRLPADGHPPAGSGMDIYAERLLQRIKNGEEVVR